MFSQSCSVKLGSRNKHILGISQPQYSNYVGLCNQLHCKVFTII